MIGVELAGKYTSYHKYVAAAEKIRYDKFTGCRNKNQ